MAAHYLIRITTPARIAAHTSMAVLMTWPAPPQQVISSVLLLGCGYPLLLAWLQVRLGNKAWTARAGLLVDALVTAVLLTLAEAPLWLFLLAANFLTASIGLIANWRWLLVTLMLYGVGMAGAFAILGRPMTVDPGLLEISLVAMLCYAGFSANLGYLVSGDLGQRGKIARRRSVDLSRQVGRQAPYLPVPLTDPGARQPVRRCHLVVCFIDLAGFTRLMDTWPEDAVAGRLNEYLALMSGIALDHGATVDKFMGDGIMILFGAPRSRGRLLDVAACLRMALAMRTAFGRLRDRWRRQMPDLAVNIRMGVHAGYCTVGSFGCAHRMDYTAVGGVVNISSRLEGAAPEGAILVSHQVQQLSGEGFHFLATRNIDIKGISTPIRVAELQGAAPFVQSCRLLSHQPGV